MALEFISIILASTKFVLEIGCSATGALLYVMHTIVLMYDVPQNTHLPNLEYNNGTSDIPRTVRITYCTYDVCMTYHTYDVRLTIVFDVTSSVSYV